MTRLIPSWLTFVTTSLSNASSTLATDFWQPRPACYGQAASGDDEILFINRSHPCFIHPAALGH